MTSISTSAAKFLILMAIFFGHPVTPKCRRLYEQPLIIKVPIQMQQVNMTHFASPTINERSYSTC